MLFVIDRIITRDILTHEKSYIHSEYFQFCILYTDVFLDVLFFVCFYCNVNTLSYFLDNLNNINERFGMQNNFDLLKSSGPDNFFGVQG